MNDGIKRFEELLKTDETFREKLKSAAEAYKGEQDEKAVFEQVLVPVASEYGITATYQEFSDYIHSMQKEDAEIMDSELQQVAGGGKGAGAAVCWILGVGVGGTDDDDGHVRNHCLGIGYGSTGACAGEGIGTSL